MNEKLKIRNKTTGATKVVTRFEYNTEYSDWKIIEHIKTEIETPTEKPSEITKKRFSAYHNEEDK